MSNLQYYHARQGERGKGKKISNTTKNEWFESINHQGNEGETSLMSRSINQIRYFTFISTSRNLSMCSTWCIVDAAD